VLLSCITACMMLFSGDGMFRASSAEAQRAPDVERYIADWHDVEPQTMYGLTVYDILTPLRGTERKPRRTGAVLTDVIAVRRATLPSGDDTGSSVTSEGQRIYYVLNGSGTVESESEPHQIQEGSGILVPADVPVTFSATEALEMYLIEEPPLSGGNGPSGIVVRSEHDNPISTNLERTGSRDWLFSAADGLSVLQGINPIIFEPRSGFPAHVHPPGVEEIWIALWDGLSFMMGDMKRTFPPGSAYKAVADGATAHTNVNLSNEPGKLLWMMKAPRYEPRRPQRRDPLDRFSHGVELDTAG
jgi:mannose-6-phosphate isomerase-like protein (cupin superfamily)